MLRYSSRKTVPLLKWLVRRGKDFPPHPHFFGSTANAWFCDCSLSGCGGRSRGLTRPPAAADSSPPVFDGLRQRAFAALRSTASRLLLAARFYRNERFSHIRSAAPAALIVPGCNGRSLPPPKRVIPLNNSLFLSEIFEFVWIFCLWNAKL